MHFRGLFNNVLSRNIPDNQEEMPMWFVNARIYIADKGFREGSFCVENGRFTGIRYREDVPYGDFMRMYGNAEMPYPESVRAGELLLSELGSLRGPGVVDLQNMRVIPGLVDIHTHGNSGADFSDGDPEGLRIMAAYLAGQGITTFLPASMTLPEEQLEKAFRNAASFQKEDHKGCAHLAGIHMEGPFFSYHKRGAQNEVYLKNPDRQMLQRLQETCGGLIRIADLAPELDGAEEFIRKSMENSSEEKAGEPGNFRISLGHTDADYDTARRAFEAGARHVTHLFNAMPPLLHRDPGVIGAAAEREDVTAELICDGVHVHPSVVRAAFHLFPHRVCLISDALRCCGMPEGDYELGGQPVRLKDGVARLRDGTIAGSATNLYECMKNAMAFGIPAEEAIEAATRIPAEFIGAGEEIGNIAPGYRADFLVCDDTWNLQQVYMAGEVV